MYIKKIIYYIPLLIFVFDVSIVNAQSTAYKLATIEKGGYVSKNDLLVKRFQNLLDQLSNTYVENESRIADMTVNAKNILEKAGIQESMINMMTGMNLIFSSKIENQKYSEYISAYIVLREKGYGNEEAIKGLQGVVSTMLNN